MAARKPRKPKAQKTAAEAGTAKDAQAPAEPSPARALTASENAQADALLPSEIRSTECHGQPLRAKTVYVCAQCNHTQDHP